MQISTGLGRQRAYRTNGCPIADGVLGTNITPTRVACRKRPSFITS